MWAGRTVALLHCRTACTAEPANVRTFPSLSTRSLDLCAHFLASPPRQGRSICAHFSGRAVGLKSAHIFDARGEISQRLPQNVRTNQESGLEREGNVRTFACSAVRSVRSVRLVRCPAASGRPSSALQVGALLGVRACRKEGEGAGPLGLARASRPTNPRKTITAVWTPTRCSPSTSVPRRRWRDRRSAGRPCLADASTRRPTMPLRAAQAPTPKLP